MDSSKLIHHNCNITWINKAHSQIFSNKVVGPTPSLQPSCFFCVSHPNVMTSYEETRDTRNATRSSHNTRARRLFLMMFHNLSAYSNTSFCARFLFLKVTCYHDYFHNTFLKFTWDFVVLRLPNPSLIINRHSGNSTRRTMCSGCVIVLVMCG